MPVPASATKGPSPCAFKWNRSSPSRLLSPAESVDVTIECVDGGYSSAAERLTVAQDVVGSIPTSRPNEYPY